MATSVALPREVWVKIFDECKLASMWKLSAVCNHPKGQLSMFWYRDGNQKTRYAFGDLSSSDMIRFKDYQKFKVVA